MTVRGPAARSLAHHAAVYASDQEFVDAVVPFIEEGLADGQPTLLVCETDRSHLLRSAIPDPSQLMVLDPVECYGHPLATLKQHLEALETHHRTPGFRMVGEIPPSSLATRWHAWLQYEIAVNRMLAHSPVQALCSFDERAVPPFVLDGVTRAHPQLVRSDGTVRQNPRYSAAGDFLEEWAHRDVDPLEHRQPHLELLDPTARRARRAVAALANGTALDTDTVDGLAVAVSESVTNAVAHGSPPVCVRAWAAGDRLVVHVADSGRGPDDPLVGVLPPPDGATHGHGLWIARRLCTTVALRTDPEQFVVRLVAGTPRRPDLN